jgi:hypothetical protein
MAQRRSPVEHQSHSSSGFRIGRGRSPVPATARTRSSPVSAAPTSRPASRCPGGSRRGDPHAPFVRQSHPKSALVFTRRCDRRSQSHAARPRESNPAEIRKTGWITSASIRRPMRIGQRACFRAERRRSRTYPPTGYAGLADFEGLLRKVQPSTEAGFRPRFSPSRCGEVRWDRYQFRYQVGTRQLVRQRAVTVPMSRVVRALLHRADWWRLDSTA